MKRTTPEHGWKRHKAVGFKETLLHMTERVIQEMSEGSGGIFHQGLEMGFVGLFFEHGRMSELMGQNQPRRKSWLICLCKVSDQLVCCA